MGCPTEVEIGDNLVFSVTTHDPDTGVLTDADAVPDWRLYEDETGVAILNGVMAKLDDANTTGFYTESVACTAGNGFENGKTYTVYIEATVDGDEGGICYAFKAYDSRDVNVVTWLGVAPLALLAQRVQTSVGAMAATVLTAAATAADFFAGVQAEAEDALEAYDLDHLIQVTAGVEEPTQDSYLDQMMHKDAGQTFAKATDSLEAIRDTAPLGTAMRGTDGASTHGDPDPGGLIDAAISSRSSHGDPDPGGLIDAAISSRSSHTAAAVWAVGARTLTSFGTLVADIWAAGARTLTDLTGFSLSAAGIQAIWDALTANLTTVGSIGKRLVDDIDATISSRSSHTAAAVWAVGARTLTGFGTLVADIWAAGARTLTDKVGFSLAADQSTVTIGTVNAFAAAAIDSIFARTSAAMEAGVHAWGTLYGVIAAANHFKEPVGGKLRVYESDEVTPLQDITITTDPLAEPIVAMDPD